MLAGKANGACEARHVDHLKVMEHAFRIFSSDIIQSIEFKALTDFDREYFFYFDSVEYIALPFQLACQIL